ncbi:MAG TPA: ABC transporter permease subunit [Pirellulales bacterium]|nr:ABC transporter permease subunit [Pirellulales bacterium]
MQHTTRKLAVALVPWLLPLLLLAGWQTGCQIGWISARYLPAPSAVVRAGAQLTANGQLPKHLGISTARALAGFLIGGTLGMAFGLLTGLSPLADRFLDTSVQMVRTIPHLALIPLVILWFGIDEQAKLFLIALGVFFPMYINTYHGVRSIDAGLVEMAHMYGVRRGVFLCKIVIPGALPSILVGLRLGLGTMWLTLIVAETISSQAGLGYLAMNAREFMQTDIVLLSIVIYALLGKLSDSFVRWLDQRVVPWRPLNGEPIGHAPSLAAGAT